MQTKPIREGGDAHTQLGQKTLNASLKFPKKISSQVWKSSHVKHTVEKKFQKSQCRTDPYANTDDFKGLTHISKNYTERKKAQD